MSGITINTMSKKKAVQLGDAVEKVTEITGIKSLVKYMAGEDCGCKERKEKPNEWGESIKQRVNDIFKRQINALTPEEYQYLDQFFSTYRGVVNISQQQKLLDINNRVFSQKLQYSTCGSCVLSMVNQLKKVYNAYTIPTQE